jgi:hypothetical protein
MASSLVELIRIDNKAAKHLHVTNSCKGGFVNTLVNVKVTLINSPRVHSCCKPPRYVPYKGTYIPYNGTYGASDQGQMLDV